MMNWSILGFADRFPAKPSDEQVGFGQGDSRSEVQ